MHHALLYKCNAIDILGMTSTEAKMGRIGCLVAHATNSNNEILDSGYISKHSQKKVRNYLMDHNKKLQKLSRRIIKSDHCRLNCYSVNNASNIGRNKYINLNHRVVNTSTLAS